MESPELSGDEIWLSTGKDYSGFCVGRGRGGNKKSSQEADALFQVRGNVAWILTDVLYELFCDGGRDAGMLWWMAGLSFS